MDIQTFGYTFHPFALSFNLSCHPNVEMKIFGDQGVTAWIVQYPVKAGNQLFISHKYNEWNVMEKKDRMKHWCQTGRPKCRCEACVNNWELEKVPNHESIHAYFPKMTYKREEALKIYEENCKFINQNYEKKFPTGEL
jgi:hypothetical protein